MGKSSGSRILPFVPSDNFFRSGNHLLPDRRPEPLHLSFEEGSRFYFIFTFISGYERSSCSHRDLGRRLARMVGLRTPASHGSVRGQRDCLGRWLLLHQEICRKPVGPVIGQRSFIRSRRELSPYILLCGRACLVPFCHCEPQSGAAIQYGSVVRDAWAVRWDAPRFRWIAASGLRPSSQ
jgi:hypothetical protein